MKKPQLTPLLLSATLFLSVVGVAKAAEDSVAPAPESPRKARQAELIKKFDKNGDGKLDETERAAAREAMQAMQAMRHERPNAMRGPGDEEKGPRPAPGAMGMRDPAFRHGYMLGKFDKNGDGKLDEAEKADAHAAAEMKMRTRLEKQIQRLKEVDANGDGKISDSEWAVAREKFQKERGAPGGAGRPDEDFGGFPPPMGTGPGGE
jgi:Ca2+-binding EF-hand superfamily protein